MSEAEGDPVIDFTHDQAGRLHPDAGWLGRRDQD